MKLKLVRILVERAKGWVQRRCSATAAAVPSPSLPSFPYSNRPSLPADVVLLILQSVAQSTPDSAAQHTLAQCALVSRTFRVLALPLLRARVRLKVEDDTVLFRCSMWQSSMQRIRDLVGSTMPRCRRRRFGFPSQSLIAAVQGRPLSIELYWRPSGYARRTRPHVEAVLRSFAARTASPVELRLGMLRSHGIETTLVELFCTRLRWLRVSQLEPSDVEVLAACPHLEALEVETLVDDDDGLSAPFILPTVPSLRQLSVLTIAKDGCDSTLRDFLEPFPDLVSLRLRHGWPSMRRLPPFSLSHHVHLHCLTIELPRLQQELPSWVYEHRSAHFFRQLGNLLSQSSTTNTVTGPARRFAVHLVPAVQADETFWLAALDKSGLRAQVGPGSRFQRVESVRVVPAGWA